ncbi:MAG TPA: PKD domain-containing protein, partial [Ktedonobacteraceae bacterium]|nr:PKD domain-containing protein [Ktedonobacteraceae bacterium]
RTLRFVIFDAEEQGLYGSYHYVNSTISGDLQNIVAMFNEEQNGIAYPLRYLGKANNPFLPFHVFMTPLQKSDIYPDGNKLSQQQESNISHFRALMHQAIPAVFAQFRSMGFQALTYHTDNKQDVPQQIFTPDQLKNVQQGDDVLGASDQVPFTMAGLPCVTMAGNFDGGPNGTPTPDHPAYPFDTSVDTIQLMNTFADGSSRQSQALTLALSLPAMITTWMLNQSDILGQAPAGQNPIATISDIGQTVVGQNITLDARASLSPSNSALSYTWDFGDGTKASGISVDHTYTTAKNYTLSMTVSSSQGTSTIRKTINVVAQPLNYDNPYIGFQPTGNVPLNPANILPQPDDSLSDNVLPKSLAQTSSPKTTGVTPTISTSGNINQSANPPIALFIGAGVVVLLLLLVIGIWIGIRHRKANV